MAPIPPWATEEIGVGKGDAFTGSCMNEERPGSQRSMQAMLKSGNAIAKLKLQRECNVIIQTYQRTVAHNRIRSRFCPAVPTYVPCPPEMHAYKRHRRACVPA